MPGHAALEASYGAPQPHARNSRCGVPAPGVAQPGAPLGVDPGWGSGLPHPPRPASAGGDGGRSRFPSGHMAVMAEVGCASPPREARLGNPSPGAGAAPGAPQPREGGRRGRGPPRRRPRQRGEAYSAHGAGGQLPGSSSTPIPEKRRHVGRRVSPPGIGFPGNRPKTRSTRPSRPSKNAGARAGALRA